MYKTYIAPVRTLGVYIIYKLIGPISYESFYNYGDDVEHNKPFFSTVKAS